MSKIERFHVSGCGNHNCDPLLIGRDGDYVYYDDYEKLKAENEALLTALKGMTSMYGHCWDLVDGGLLCMQDNVQRFEDAHEAAHKLITDLAKREQP